MTFNFWLKVGIKLIGVILPVITPEIRQLIGDAIKSLYAKAKMTDNPWDDFLVKLIADLLAIDVDK